ncbi:MAG TPA: hypothetical protein VGH97_11910 [Thermoanaerobaculia bacterium]|jgi:hypothetical protein
MPLQNRVDPYGRLHAVAARGAWMGNRGVLHDEARRVVAPWRLRRWITCVLEFKDRHREVFAPRRYSELFFLDEATSLAAGHRPCAECRRARYDEFRRAFGLRSSGAKGPLPGADAMDRVLHAERVTREGEKRIHPAALSALPAGVLVEHAGRACLWWNGRLLPWSFWGYGRAVAAPPGTRVDVLTPRSIVRAIRAGFHPQVHASADALARERPDADAAR